VISVKQDDQDSMLKCITTYNHHHAKLLLSSLALSVSGLLHSKNCSPRVDVEYVTAASQIFLQCFDVVIDRLSTATELGKYSPWWPKNRTIVYAL